MSNLETAPAETECAASPRAQPVTELITGREVALGRYSVVRRLLPDRARRMVGAWCFLDHFGPDSVLNLPGMRVPPHPHTGLQTVSWLLAGEILHRDSLGSEQTIRPGQLNLMTSGAGIAHSEESPQPHPALLHGCSCGWRCRPAPDSAPRFEHHADLPRVTDAGLAATVVIGALAGVASPAVVHTPLVGADVTVAGAAALALDRLRTRRGGHLGRRSRSPGYRCRPARCCTSARPAGRWRSTAPGSCSCSVASRSRRSS